MVLWRDTHPSARDLESAVQGAQQSARQVASARDQSLHGLPRSGHAAATTTCHVAGLAVGPCAVLSTRQAARHTPALASSSSVEVDVMALNRFCWDTATQPFAAEAAALAAATALPAGTDMTAEDVAAACIAAEQAATAALQHATLISTLPVWLAPGMKRQLPLSCNMTS